MLRSRKAPQRHDADLPELAGLRARRCAARRRRLLGCQGEACVEEKALEEKAQNPCFASTERVGRVGRGRRPGQRCCEGARIVSCSDMMRAFFSNSQCRPCAVPRPPTARATADAGPDAISAGRWRKASFSKLRRFNNESNNMQIWRGGHLARGHGREEEGGRRRGVQDTGANLHLSVMIKCTLFSLSAAQHDLDTR